MLPKTVLSLFLVCLSFILTAQPTNNAPADPAGDAAYLIDASRPVDPDRYTEIRGTPYRYQDFGPISVFDPTLNEYLLEKANLNGFTSQVEYYAPDGTLRELAPANFLRVEVPQEDGTKHTYGRGINPKFRDRYAQIIYRGDYITATMVYDIINDEKVVQDVGRTLKLRRFSAKSLHYAMVDGEFITLKMTAKNLAEDLGHKAEILKFIKAEKLNVNDDADLVRIYAFADSLFE